jgi:hypothetical protein
MAVFMGRSNKKRFQCPYCQAMFPVRLNQRRFECPRCGHGFSIARLGRHERGWMAVPQMAWERAHSQVIRPFPKRGELRAAAPADQRRENRQSTHATSVNPPVIGAARMRRERRLKRKRMALPMVLIGLTAVFLALLVYPHAVKGESTSEQVETAVSEMAKPITVVQAAYPIATDTSAQPATMTPIPSQTPTTTATPTPTATATPLPAHLQQATAWQATLEQAAAASHATQTLVAGNYEATQTALPPILTAMAQERQATATQKAAKATARAAGPGAR